MMCWWMQSDKKVRLNASRLHEVQFVVFGRKMLRNRRRLKEQLIREIVPDFLVTLRWGGTVTF